MTLRTRDHPRRIQIGDPVILVWLRGRQSVMKLGCCSVAVWWLSHTQEADAIEFACNILSEWMCIAHHSEPRRVADPNNFLPADWPITSGTYEACWLPRFHVSAISWSFVPETPGVCNGNHTHFSVAFTGPVHHSNTGIPSSASPSARSDAGTQSVGSQLQLYRRQGE